MMMARRSVALLLCLLLGCNWVAQAVQNAGLSSSFSDTDSTALKALINSQTSSKDFPSNIHDAFHAVLSLSLLSSKLSEATKACDLAKKVLKSRDVLERLDSESIYHAVAVVDELKCDAATIDNSVGDALRTILEDGDSVPDFYHAVKAVLALRVGKRTAITDVDLAQVVSKVVDQFDDDGTVRTTSEDKEGTLHNAGLALELLGSLQTSLKLSDEDREAIESVSEKIDGIVSLGNEEEDSLEFVNIDEAINPLVTTSTVLKGLDTFAAALKRPIDVSPTHMTLIGEFLIEHKHVHSLADAYHLLVGLTTLQRSSISRPLVLSIERSTLLATSKGPEGYVKAKVTDVFDKYASPAKMYLVKANAQGREDSTLLSNQELQADSDNSKNNVFQFNFIAAKPDQGFYTLDIRVVPTGKDADLYGTIESATRTIKVVGMVTITDFELSVADSKDAHEREGSKYRAEVTSKIEESIRIDHIQSVKVGFRVRSHGGSNRPLIVQQAFVKLIHVQSGHEVTFVAKPNENKAYSVLFSVDEATQTFRSLSGTWRLELVVGDAFIQNPIHWVVCSHVDVHFVTPALAASDGPLSPKPEIIHMFRVPEQRPPESVSSAFTLFTLAPILFLLVGLVVAGANIKRFPSGGLTFLHAVFFQGSIGAILFLLAIYWLKLNMVQTLGYLSLLSIPALFFGQRTLSHLAKESKLKSQ